MEQGTEGEGRRKEEESAHHAHNNEQPPEKRGLSMHTATPFPARDTLPVVFFEDEGAGGSWCGFGGLNGSCRV